MKRGFNLLNKIIILLFTIITLIMINGVSYAASQQADGCIIYVGGNDNYYWCLQEIKGYQDNHQAGQVCVGYYREMANGKKAAIYVFNKEGGMLPSDINNKSDLTINIRIIEDESFSYTESSRQISISDGEEITTDFLITQLNSYMDKNYDEQLGDLEAYDFHNTDTNDKFVGKVNKLFGVLRIVGTIVSVVALMAIGIRYMAVSVEERAQYKKAMIPYVIGAVMVFAITTLLSVIAGVAESTF